MDFKSSNPLGVIGIIGAVVLIIGVFMNWVTYDYNLPSSVYGISKLSLSWSGMDIFNGSGFFAIITSAGANIQYTFIPIIALFCGLYALIAMSAATLKDPEDYETINNGLGLSVLILSLVVVICTILFAVQNMTFNIGGSSVSFGVGIGVWFTLAGAIVTLIGGLMPVIKSKFLNSESAPQTTEDAPKTE